MGMGIKTKLKALAHELIYKTNYRVRKTSDIDFFDMLLDALLQRNGNLSYIQIGANDGKSFDPIYQFMSRNRHQVRGVLLEPLKDYFNELTLNYKDIPNVTLVNKAIHNTNKSMTIYRVDPSKVSQEDMDTYAKGIASFNKEHHELSGTSDNVMMEEEVECISMSELITEYNLDKVDLLQIDTEGYDAEIILGIDFETFRPSIVNFEHGLPDGILDSEKFKQVTDKLHQYGYEIWMKHYDATAYQRHLFY